MDQLQKVSHNLIMRCEAYLQTEGGQFQHVIKHGKFVSSSYNIVAYQGGLRELRDMD
jgi:hypothetical protein